MLRYPLQAYIFTARCYACAILAMDLCLCLSVCRQTQVGVLLKRLNTGSHKQHHTIAPLVSGAKDLSEIRPGSPPAGAPNAGGVVRGHSRSSAMSLFDRAHTTSYSTLMETMRLFCTVFEIQPVICRKSPILTHHTCIWRPRRG